MVPIIIYVAYVLFLIFWVYSALYIYSAGEEVLEPNGPFDYVDYDKGIGFILFLHFVEFLWVSEFFASLSYFITSIFSS